MTTRTFAIIKPGIIEHRFDIETLISQAGFETIKERQLAFHPEDENLSVLFGEESESLKGGPVWVYVLEKVNAVTDFLALIAPSDDATSIHSVYGDIYASPDRATADMQISTIFASSPPFPPANPAIEEADIPELPSIRRPRLSSHVSQVSSEGKSSTGGSSFRARPAPPSSAAPAIQPRTTKAALLRQGITPTASPPKRAPLTKERLAETFANVPGHKRANTISVASTAPPRVAPRPTRASLLRTGQDSETIIAPVAPRARRSLDILPTSETPGYKRPSLQIKVASTAPPAITPRATRASSLRIGNADNSVTLKPKSSRLSISEGSAGANTFEGIPGHKRRETISVASTKPPTTVPRLNRSATLRSQNGAFGGPPSSFKGATTTDTGGSVGHARGQSLSRQTSRSSITSNTTIANTRPAISRGRSSIPPSSFIAPNAASSPSQGENSKPPSRAPSLSRTSSRGSISKATSTSLPPTIAPKTNRSALLRAAKIGLNAVGVSTTDKKVAV